MIEEFKNLSVIDIDFQEAFETALKNLLNELISSVDTTGVSVSVSIPGECDEQVASSTIQICGQKNHEEENAGAVTQHRIPVVLPALLREYGDAPTRERVEIYELGQTTYTETLHMKTSDSLELARQIFRLLCSQLMLFSPIQVEFTNVKSDPLLTRIAVELKEQIDWQTVSTGEYDAKIRISATHPMLATRTLSESSVENALTEVQQQVSEINYIIYDPES